MGFAISMVLIAAGAIMRWAVTDTVEDVNFATIGLILLIVGGVGALASLVFWGSWGGFNGSRRSVGDRREEVG